MDTHRTAFREPKKSSRLIRISPPLVHLTPYVTGGLGQLYKNIKENKHDWLQGYSQFTDKDGIFVPKSDMPLLAGRYKYVNNLGKGQSSILVKAQDTFCPELFVSIKVLHTHYTVLGAQEMDCIRKLNRADPKGVSSTLRLLNTFTFAGHYCMVFELLNPKSLLTHFKAITEPQKKMVGIRKVVLRLLQALGFFRQENVIHADLKPENILLEEGGTLSQLKVVDLGNALHCVHEELSLYYDDFELQTLLYRAPEVMYGLPFGVEVDMWSLGCIIAELYIGQPLFYGTDKKTILSKMTSILGPLPRSVFQKGKFYTNLQTHTNDGGRKDGCSALMKVLKTNDYEFADFVKGFLEYDPAKRMTIPEAAQHPFLAPELGLRFLIPHDTDTPLGYPTVILSRDNYPMTPAINPDVSKRRLTSTGLLRHGTLSTVEPPRRVAQIVPLVRGAPANCTAVPPIQQPDGSASKSDNPKNQSISKQDRTVLAKDEKCLDGGSAGFGAGFKTKSRSTAEVKQMKVTSTEAVMQQSGKAATDVSTASFSSSSQMKNSRESLQAAGLLCETYSMGVDRNMQSDRPEQQSKSAESIQEEANSSQDLFSPTEPSPVNTRKTPKKSSRNVKKRASPRNIPSKDLPPKKKQKYRVSSNDSIECQVVSSPRELTGQSVVTMETSNDNSLDQSGPESPEHGWAIRKSSTPRTRKAPVKTAVKGETKSQPSQQRAIVWEEMYTVDSSNSSTGAVSPNSSGDDVLLL